MWMWMRGLMDDKLMIIMMSWWMILNFQIFRIYSQSNKKSGRNLWPSEIFSVVRDSPYWNIFKSKKIIVWEKKFRSLHPREQKKLVGVFTFFNGALEKKLEWCDQKNRIRSADGSIWQNANKKTCALSNRVLTHNFFNFWSSTNILSSFCRGDSELLVSVIIFFRNLLQTILHDPLLVIYFSVWWNH